MRGRRGSTLWCVVTASALTAVGATGCFDRSICEYAICGVGGAGGAAPKLTSSDASTTIASSSSGVGPCDPANLPAGASIGAQCGIFVRPGAAGGDGSQATPFGTLEQALLGNGGAKPVYVCATAGPIVESISLVAAERLHGGLTCDGWATSANKTEWTAAANEVPLVLDHAVNALVRRFAIHAANGAGFDPVTLQGGSSVAIILDGAGGELVDVDVAAGTGAKGGDGIDAIGSAPGRDTLPSSFDGNVGGGCDAPGGAAKIFSMCPAGNATLGGKGGNGGVSTGTIGNAGGPGLPGGEPDGSPGAGDDGSAGWSCVSNAGDGDDGHDGPDGDPGDGGSGPGTIDGLGWLGPLAGDGGAGSNAQGGGGGGGRRQATDACATTGASGGSGGAGGCGGLGGRAGGAGGASIGIVSVSALVTLTNVHVVAAAGGAGGDGGGGQLGGSGGFGAIGGGSACGGGDGGDGGDGGGGGGGIGGPSIGVASFGEVPAIDPSFVQAAAAAAPGGLGGVGGTVGVDGADGDVAQLRSFL